MTTMTATTKSARAARLQSLRGTVTQNVLETPRRLLRTDDGRAMLRAASVNVATADVPLFATFDAVARLCGVIRLTRWYPPR
jgi:hypothetical protein